MKKILLLFILIPMVYSCNNDESGESVKILRANPSTLTFPVEGGSRTFEVTTKNVSLGFSEDGDWINWDEIDVKREEDGIKIHTVKVILRAGPREGRAGKITLHGMGVDNYQVGIRQLADPDYQPGISE